MKFLVNPFTNKYVYVRLAKEQAASLTRRLNDLDNSANVRIGLGNMGGSMHVSQAISARFRALSPGHVTYDQCPEPPGDDTVHSPIPHVEAPEFISSPFPKNVADNDTVDVVILDFIIPWIQRVLGNGSDFELKPYGSDIMSNQIFGLYAQKVWAKDRSWPARVTEALLELLAYFVG